MKENLGKRMEEGKRRLEKGRETGELWRIKKGRGRRLKLCRIVIIGEEGRQRVHMVQ